MISYCIGNSKEFRSRRGAGIVNCDNEELAPIITTKNILASSMADGQKLALKYFWQRKKNKVQIPFGSLTILEFVRFSRALVDKEKLSEQAVLTRIKSVGLKRRLDCKLKKITAIEYRALCLATKISDFTHSAYINFEGLKFCRKNKRAVNSFAKLCAIKYKTYILVDDKRFINI